MIKVQISDKEELKDLLAPDEYGEYVERQSDEDDEEDEEDEKKGE